MYLPLDAAAIVVAEVKRLASEKATEELRGFLAESYAAFQQQRMTTIHGGSDPISSLLQPAETREEFVEKNLKNDKLMQLYMSIYGDKWIFASRHGSMEVVGTSFDSLHLPKDLDAVQVNVNGPAGKAILINALGKFDPTKETAPFNQVLVQGNDDQWVTATHGKLSNSLMPHRKLGRTLVYRFFLVFALLTFLALCAIEFRLYKAFRPDFTLATPLTGLNLLVGFLLLAINMRIADRGFLAGLQYTFPYFELEANLSQPRIDMRRWVMLTLVTVYGVAIATVLGWL